MMVMVFMAGKLSTIRRPSKALCKTRLDVWPMNLSFFFVLDVRTLACMPRVKSFILILMQNAILMRGYGGQIHTCRLQLQYVGQDKLITVFMRDSLQDQDVIVM